MLLIAHPVLADPAPQRQQQLLELLKQDCGACHGLTLKGGLGPALLPENIKHQSDESLVHAIQNGRPGTPMPPWRDFISVAETEWLVRYLRKPKTGVDSD